MRKPDLAVIGVVILLALAFSVFMVNDRDHPRPVAKSPPTVKPSPAKTKNVTSRPVKQKVKVEKPAPPLKPFGPITTTGPSVHQD